MNEKILFVDDDVNILSAYRRNLGGRYHVETVSSALSGLEILKRQEPYAVIVADQKMPGMDGIEFLTKVSELCPDTVRMLLTGHANQQTVISAINEGQIFRFMSKPCSPETLALMLEAGLRQYRLVTAEKELLERTLKGSVKVLTGVLALASPKAFGRAERVTRLVLQLAAKLSLQDPWKLEIASMLSQLGCITVPEQTLSKVYCASSLSDIETAMFKAHPKVGCDLIAKIPRLEEIAEIVAYQEKHFDGSGTPSDKRSGDEIPQGSRILKLALDYDALITGGTGNADAMTIIRSRAGWYDPQLVDELERALAVRAREGVAFVGISELAPNMILDEDVKTQSGMLLIAKGQEVTPSLRVRVMNFARFRETVREPIKVRIPDLSADEHLQTATTTDNPG